MKGLQICSIYVFKFKVALLGSSKLATDELIVCKLQDSINELASSNA